MDVAKAMMEKYQTSLPTELAKRLGVEIQYQPLPVSVRSLYVPTSATSVIVLNSRIAELRQQFYLCYHLRKHIEEKTPILFEPEKAEDYEIIPSSFALDILMEHGTLDRCVFKRLGQFLSVGADAKLLIPWQTRVRQARCQHLALTMR